MEASKTEVDTARGRGIQVFESDLNKRLPFEDKTFDVITANQVLEHVWNIDSLLLEIRRILKDDGIFIV